MKTTKLLLAVFFLNSWAPLTQAQELAWEYWSSGKYQSIPNITYLNASGEELNLDVYIPRNAAGPVPTLIYYHGGGWVGGSKERSMLAIMPYLSKGWAAVNVQYRLGNVARAPAAVEDIVCALRWVGSNAEDYGFDIGQLVVTGHSAGGHLSLMAGMLPADTDLANQCPASETPTVAAVVNWFGITDVADLLDGVNRKNYAVAWMGSQIDRYEIAERVSPLTHVRPDLPPVITIHGDADPVVPYEHAERLHQGLQEVGVANKLITIPDGGHGGFSETENLQSYQYIFEFLDENLRD